MRSADRLVLFLALAGAVAWAAPPERVEPVVFEEVAAARGLRFTTNSGRTARRHQPETMVSGVALLDYDGDGRLDVYAVNGAPIDGLRKTGPEYWNRLFHQNADGTFTDVTEKAGVAGRGYDLGVVTGDYDNDGDPDIFVAGLRRNTLFRNNGDGTFTDVTEAAGLARPDPTYGTLWAVAAAFVDYDHDGRLDLFVSNYCVWDPAKEPLCGDPSRPDYCHPKQYQGLPNSLFHNRGDGTFTDVSAPSGIRAHVGKGMGIGAADFDGDGWVDLFVSNDTLPSFLFMNGRDGTFKESAFDRAVAFPDRAEAVSGMGAAAGDVDNDGWPDVFQTALSNETFRSSGTSERPCSRRSRRGPASRWPHARARGGETGSWTSTTTDGRTCSWPPPTSWIRRAASGSGSPWPTRSCSTSRADDSRTGARGRAPNSRARPCTAGRRSGTSTATAGSTWSSARSTARSSCGATSHRRAITGWSWTRRAPRAIAMDRGRRSGSSRLRGPSTRR
jgi:hypothetical protein